MSGFVVNICDVTTRRHHSQFVLKALVLKFLDKLLNIVFFNLPWDKKKSLFIKSYGITKIIIYISVLDALIRLGVNFEITGS